MTRTSSMTVVLVAASLLAACGGGAASPPPTTNSNSHLVASPQAIQVNNLSGAPLQQTVTISGLLQTPYALAAPLGATATDLSFMGVSLQSPSGTSAALQLFIVGAGSSTITVRQGGNSVAIPVTSIPCGRPDMLQYAALVSPPSGATNVSLNTSSFLVEVAGTPQVSPFQPALRAHFVVNNAATIDPQATLTPATPAPGTMLPVPSPPPTDSVAFESGTMPQLAPGQTYTLYVYSDSCEVPWKAGTFST